MKCKYEGSGAWEGRCVGTKEVDPCIGIEKCDRYKPDYMTNADRLRAMSDEELAEFLILSPEMEFAMCCYCKYGNPTPMDDRGFCLHPFGSCLANARAEAFKNWLKQPVKDGDNDAV